MKRNRILHDGIHFTVIAFVCLAVYFFYSKHTYKYTILAQENAYQVDNFRIIGGQLVLEEKGKRVIIKGNYIIEINETDEKREAISTTE